MAASVLGKRTRRTVRVEDVSLPLPTRKRRTLTAAAPQIHEDDVRDLSPKDGQGAPQLMDLDDVPIPTRIVSSKRTVQNKYVQRPTHETDAAENIASAVQDENVPPFEFRTPSTIRFKDALALQGSITPRHRVKLGGEALLLTPRTPRTGLTPRSRSQSVYAAARQLFTQSSSPGRLVGRDAERQQVTDFISNAIESKTGGCTYISGPPGTGKSALIQEIFEKFRSDSTVKIANVNCVSLGSSKEVLTSLVQEFCKDVANAKQPQKKLLLDLFLPRRRTETNSYLVLLDEIDNLLDDDCDVLYSLFEWALHRQSNLILIGIANALDLTDRFLPRLKARNLKPRLLPFLPYTATQISAIISERLRSTLSQDKSAATDFVPFVHPMAIQLCSKKVASQTGDLRKAFSLIRRAVGQVELETVEKEKSSIASNLVKNPLAEISNQQWPLSPSKSSPLRPQVAEATLVSKHTVLTPETAPRATIAHVARIASGIFNNGTSARLASLNMQQKAVLCSLVANEKKRACKDPFVTPSKSTSSIPTVKDLFVRYATLCKREDGLLQPLKSTEFRDVVASLETLGLLHEWTGRSTGLLTPSKTPSRSGRSADDKQVASAVSEKEMKESLKGPGAHLLERLFDE